MHQSPTSSSMHNNMNSRAGIFDALPGRYHRKSAASPSQPSSQKRIKDETSYAVSQTADWPGATISGGLRRRRRTLLCESLQILESIELCSSATAGTRQAGGDPGWPVQSCSTRRCRKGRPGARLVQVHEATYIAALVQTALAHPQISAKAQAEM